MGKKKVFLLLVSLLFISLFSNYVSASNHEGTGLGDAFDTIRELFAFLPDLVTLEKLIGGDTAAIFWAKFLVWLLLFAVLFFGASKVFPDNKRISVVVAIIIALMGALLIPNSILINIFQTYGLVAGIIIWAIPLIAGMFIAHKVENPFARTLIYGLAAWILFSINKTVVELQGFANSKFPFFGLLLAVVILLFFWNLGQIFGIGGGGTGGGGRIGEGLGRLFGGGGGLNDFLGRTPRDETTRQRETEQANEVHNRLGTLETDLNERIQRTENDEIQRLRELSALIAELRDVQNRIRRIRE